MMRSSRISPDILINESLGEADLAASFMCVNAMKLLVYADEHGGIQLTKSGGLYRKFVTWAADEFCWPGHEPAMLYAVNRVLNEQDFIPLALMHDLLRGARLIRHFKKKAVLTKAGKTMLGDYGALQANLFDAYFTSIDLSTFERFPMDYGNADLRHFLNVINNRAGGWVKLSRLAERCLPIHAVIGSRINPVTDACFHLMFHLVRPLMWLGLLEQAALEKRTNIEDRLFRKTALFDQFVRVMHSPHMGVQVIQ